MPDEALSAASRLRGLAQAYRQLQGMLFDVVTGFTSFGIDAESDGFQAFIDRLLDDDGEAFAETVLSGPVDAKRTGNPARVRDFLMTLYGGSLVSNGDVLTAQTDDIAVGVGLDPTTTYRVLSLLKRQGQAERSEDGGWRWTGVEEWNRRITVNRIETNQDLWLKLQTWGEPTITGHQLAELLGREGGAISSIIRALRNRCILHPEGRAWTINREVLQTYLEVNEDEAEAHAYLAAEEDEAEKAEEDEAHPEEKSVGELLEEAGIIFDLDPNAVQRARIVEGRRQVSSGERPPIKDAIKQILAHRRKATLGDLMGELERNKWMPNSSNPRDYVAQIIHHHPDDFEVIQRGVYRAKRK